MCKKGVGTNSINCMQWVHKKCRGLTGSLNVVSFERTKCVEGGGRGGKEMEIDCKGKVKCVGKFCYLGDMIGSGGGAEERLRAIVRCAWAKFQEKSPIRTARGASLR